MSVSVLPVARCAYCGAIPAHPQFSCPRIAAVDFEDGEISRIEFHDWTTAAIGGDTRSPDEAS